MNTNIPKIIGGVATTPFEHKKVTSGAIATGSKFEHVDTSIKLTELTVLVPGISIDPNYNEVAKQLSPGMKVYVWSNKYTEQWAKQELVSPEGKKYIIVPFYELKAIK